MTEEAVVVVRQPDNPVLTPKPDLLWEKEAAFNLSVLKNSDGFWAIYRALSAKQDYDGQVLNLSSIGVAFNHHSLNFNQVAHHQLISPSESYDWFGCEDPRVTYIDGQYLIFYTAISAWPPDKQSIKVAVALSDDLVTVNQKQLVTPFNAKAMALFPEKINGRYLAVLTVNTDNPPSKIALAWFDSLEQIWDLNYWRDWYRQLHLHTLPVARFNTDHIEVGAVPVKTEAGWVLIYSHIQNYYDEPNRVFGIEALLLDLEDPSKVIGRTEAPLLVPKAEYEQHGMIQNVIFPSGALVLGDDLYIFYGAADTVGAAAKVKLGPFLSLLKNSQTKAIWKFHKYPHNPILTPKESQSWQAQAVFNSAAVYEDNQFYLFYRAMSWDNTSTIGCAVSHDGFHFAQVSDEPVYVPREAFEQKDSPNGFSGCEDPRMTRIGDHYYMFYTAYDGKRPKVALTSISVHDLINHRWRWTKPVVISNPEVDNKNACLFPEKVNGKYVVLHRAAGHNIALDFIDKLSELKIGYELEKEAVFSPRPGMWDSAKIGIAGPPIKTDKGWLLIYHGVSDKDHHYRLGYMILDLNDPFHVLYRSHYPILEPEYDYERVGIVNNVVFSCGAVEKDGVVYLYYGGADKVMAVATLKLDKLLAVPLCSESADD